MKTKDIAAEYGIDRVEFEIFLKQKGLRFRTGLLSGMTVDDADAARYVDGFRKYKSGEKTRTWRVAEQENKRVKEAAQEEAVGTARRQEAAKQAARQRAGEEEIRKQRILLAEKEYLEQERNEQEILPEESGWPEYERREKIMANCVKLYREKLTGNWEVCGAITANTDILGMWVKEFSYSGEDGIEQHASTGGVNKNFVFNVYVTGNEFGKCMLLVKGNPNGFCCTFGEICFTEDGGFCTVQCAGSHFILRRI